MSTNNGIEDLSEKEFKEKIKDKAVIDFYADWCMPCVMMSPIVEDMAKEFKGKLKFGKINIDENSSIARQNEVMSIPTLIFFKEGEEKARITGSLPAEQLKEKIKSFAG